MKRRSRRGFTLVELLVASTLGVILSLAAVAFVAHETQLLGFTHDRIEMSQSARFAIDRLSADLRLAGAAVGYDESGAFAGLELGTIPRGGAVFRSANRPIALESGSFVTDDVAILLATGGYATIAAYNPAGAGQLCAGSGIEEDEVVLLQSEDGLSARTVRVRSIAGGVCRAGDCRDGCDDFTFDPDPSFLSGSDAADASYENGLAAGGFRRVVWFVDTSDPDRPGVGRLRRADGDCAAADASCGVLMADGVESLQIRVFERSGPAWLDRTDTQGRLSTRDRFRVDLEIVVRSRRAQDHVQDPITLALETGSCLPACGQSDSIARYAVRTSVEIKNASRLSYGGRR